MNSGARGMAPGMKSAAPFLLFPVALLALAAAGCRDPVEELQKYMVHGYTAEDLLPGDREVGSWRLSGRPESIGARQLDASLGREAGERAELWGPGESFAAAYHLGSTGRRVTVEIYEMGDGYGAFDVYSFVRAKALAGEKPAARVTKVGAQGLIFTPTGRLLVVPTPKSAVPHTMFVELGTGETISETALLMWMERFLVRLVHGQAALPADGEKADDPAAEAALLAFGNAIAGKVKRPGELAEAYYLQISGEVPNSECYSPEGLLGRRELPNGVTALWKGRTGEGQLFMHMAASGAEAERSFEKLRAAAGGSLTPNYADGLFVGSLPRLGPIVCLRVGRIVAGLAGSAEAEERMAAIDELRGRCPGGTPAAGGKGGGAEDAQETGP